MNAAGLRQSGLVFPGTAQDDMELAPDFFPYFEALAPVLDHDDRLLCISSWNDHGQVPTWLCCLLSCASSCMTACIRVQVAGLLCEGRAFFPDGSL